MGTVEFQTRHTFDRRIGRRVDIEPVDVTWVVPQSGRFGTKKRPLEAAGQILNLSITGAAVTGPPDLPLAPGATVHLRCDGRESVVVVRHAEPLDGGRATRYGLEITRAHPSMQRRINTVLADAPAAMPTPVATMAPVPASAPTTAPAPAVEPVLDLTGDDAVIDLTEPPAAIDTVDGAAPTGPTPSHGHTVLGEVFDLMDDSDD